MVNFAAAALLALSPFVPAACGDGVMTVQDAILEDEISKLIEQGPSQSTGEAARTFVPTRIPKTLANRLYGLLSSLSSDNTCENNKDGGKAACALDNKSLHLNTDLLDITTLTGNSQPHVDVVKVMTDNNAAESEETEHEPSRVAFIPLESNPNAVFVHGQEEIPIEKGTLIQFDGRIHHNTQVVRGGGGVVTPVRMLGPFTWKSDLGFARVTFTGGNGGKKSKTSGPKSGKTSGPKSAKSGAENGLPCLD